MKDKLPMASAKIVDKRRLRASLIVLLRVSETLRMAMIPADIALLRPKKAARAAARHVARASLMVRWRRGISFFLFYKVLSIISHD